MIAKMLDDRRVDMSGAFRVIGRPPCWNGCLSLQHLAFPLSLGFQVDPVEGNHRVMSRLETQRMAVFSVWPFIAGNS